MKRTVIGIIFIITAICTGVISLLSINKTCDSIVTAIDELSYSAENKNTNEVNEKTDALYDLWNEKKYILHILTNHSEMQDLEISMEKINHYGKKDDFSSIAEECEICRDNIEHIKTSASPSISNIF